jgi:hypothetical protein
MIRYVCCDRCGSSLVEPGSVLRATAGPLRHRLPVVVNLCSDCSGLLLGWLQARHEADESGMGHALDQTAVPSPLYSNAPYSESHG